MPGRRDVHLLQRRVRSNDERSARWVLTFSPILSYRGRDVQSGLSASDLAVTFGFALCIQPRTAELDQGGQKLCDVRRKEIGARSRLIPPRAIIFSARSISAAVKTTSTSSIDPGP